MDLNELLYQHQVALIRAEHAPARGSSGAFDIVRHYEARLARHRLALGVAAYPRWMTEPRFGVA